MQYLIWFFYYGLDHPLHVFIPTVCLAMLYVIWGKQWALRVIGSRVYHKRNIPHDRGNGYIVIESHNASDEKVIEESIKDFEEAGHIKVSDELPKQKNRKS